MFFDVQRIELREDAVARNQAIYTVRGVRARPHAMTSKAMDRA